MYGITLLKNGKNIYFKHKLLSGSLKILDVMRMRIRASLFPNAISTGKCLYGGHT